MARKYLGDTFDIHGGGVDLRFPHHENEQAQSRAAGLGFANYWLHNAWVTISGEKMSKTLGNSLRIEELALRLRVFASPELTAALDALGLALSTPRLNQMLNEINANGTDPIVVANAFVDNL